MKLSTKAFLWVLMHPLCLHFSSIGQTVKEPTFASPNAASLGKYGDIPVSYHTGVPEISVPLYTIKEGNLSLPISLSYHSAGIRVDELASNVGLGWSLNAGGMITRTVQGGPDEGIVYGTMDGGNSPYQGWGWYKNQGIQPQVTACSPTPLTESSPSGVPAWTGGCRVLYYEAAKGYVDSEPDLFTFNFAGYSGKFFFDASRNVHMIPESDLFIKPVNTPSFFYSWMIITPDGTKYFFGTPAATEFSWSDPAEAGGNLHVNSTTTWYLYKIESANGESWINFTYADDTYSFGNRGGHAITFREFDAVGETYGLNPGDIQNAGDVTRGSNIVNTTIVDGKRLTQITTSSGHTTIDFTPSASARQDLSSYYKSGNTKIYDVFAANTLSKSLQFVQITAPSLCKRFEFSYDYFPSADCTGCSVGGGTTFDKKRLRLNWVQESACGSDLQPAYEFTYDPQPLPRRYSYAKDMWGYYNGIEANTGLLEAFNNPVPGITITYNTGNYRTVNETKAKAGILTKIRYPTGGTNEFIYEAHKENDAAPQLGGLRIKTLITSDNFGNVTTKNFKYPSGTLYSNPVNYKNHFPNNNDVWTGAFLGGSDFGIIHSSNPLPPMWSSQGYHIGYTKVRVEETGNGYTIYRYLNTSPAFVNPGQYPFKPSVAAVGTSELTNESFHIEGNTDDNVYLAGTSMTKINTGGSHTTTAKKVEPVGCLNCGTSTPYGLYMDYTITTYRFNMTEKIEARDGVVTTTSYTYDATNKHNNPKAIQFTNSNGQTMRTETTYPSDAGSGAPTAMYDPANVNFKNMTSLPVETKKLINGNLVERTTNTYSLIGTQILATSVKNYVTGTAEFVESQYEYDANCNIINVRKNDGVHAAFLWGYNNQYPTAAVKNMHQPFVAANKTIFHTSFEDTGVIHADAKSGGKVFSGAYNVVMPKTNGDYTLTYWKKQNVGGASWTFHEQPITITSSTTPDVVIGQSGYFVDEVRLYPKGSQMTTYSYLPGVGIQSQTDQANLTTHYEYDAAGRLKVIKNDKREIIKTYGYFFQIK